MASPQLQEIIAGMREGGPDFSQPIEVVRQGFDEMLGGLPVADDITIEKTTLAGLPALYSRSPGDADDGALLYLHGGAYVVGSAHGYRSLAAELGRQAGVPAWAVDYRLAPEHRFPCAIDDALAAYRALLDSGIDAGRIVIAGDSAGGGLTLATLVAIRDAGLPAPSCALLISPWADLACEGASLESKAAEDPALNGEGLRATAAIYLDGTDARHPLASPIHADLSGLPPVLIQVGSAEVLLDDAVRAAGAIGAAGSPITLEIWPEMVHVWHVFAFMLPEAAAAMANAGTFFRDQLAKEPLKEGV